MPCVVVEPAAAVDEQEARAWPDRGWVPGEHAGERGLGIAVRHRSCGDGHRCCSNLVEIFDGLTAGGTIIVVGGQVKGHRTRTSNWVSGSFVLFASASGLAVITSDLRVSAEGPRITSSEMRRAASAMNAATSNAVL